MMDILEKITYPGMRIEPYEGDKDRYSIFLWQPDTRDRHLPMEQRRGWDQWRTCKIPPGTTLEQAGQIVYETLIAAAAHEIRESLSVEGELHWDPHPTGLKRASVSITPRRRQGLYLEVLNQIEGR